MDATRVYAVSLHDDKGELLWLTESSMGPDEHNAVREAFEAYATPNARPVLAYDLGDSRSAVLFCAVTSRRTTAGAIMVVIDARGIHQDDNALARLLTPKLQRVVAEFADGQIEPASVELTLADSMRMPKPALPSAGAPPAGVPAVAPHSTKPPPPAPPVPSRPPIHAAEPERPSPRTAQAPPRAAPPPPRTAQAPPRAPPPPPGTAQPTSRTAQPPPSAALRAIPAVERLQTTLQRSPIALYVQRLVPLAKGSQLRRYEVLLRSAGTQPPDAAPRAMLSSAVENGLGSMIDRRVLTQLLDWLMRNPAAWRSQPALFSVNLTRTALEDEHFLRFVALCLAKSSLPASMIAFEIDVPTAVELGNRTRGVAEALDKLGSSLVLDDFDLRTECFELLRLPAVRYVKLAGKITAKMRTDKVSQAAITAVVQMARVLGMHTVAKHSETAVENEWLTALGVDFVQSNAASAPVAIDTLAKPVVPRP